MGITLLVGCDVFGPGDESGVAITTDHTEYVAERVGEECLRYGFTAVAQFRNLTKRSLYLGRCFPESPSPMYDVPRDSGGSAYTYPRACVGHDQQFAIEPGGTRTDTLEIAGPSGWDGVTGEPRGALEGEFWFLYDVRRCPGFCPDEVEERLRRSNTFSVQLAR